MIEGAGLEKPTHFYLNTFYRVDRKINAALSYLIVYFFDKHAFCWKRTFCYPPIKLMDRLSNPGSMGVQTVCDVGGKLFTGKDSEGGQCYEMCGHVMTDLNRCGYEKECIHQVERAIDEKQES